MELEDKRMMEEVTRKLFPVATDTFLWDWNGEKVGAKSDLSIVTREKVNKDEGKGAKCRVVGEWSCRVSMFILKLK